MSAARAHPAQGLSVWLPYRSLEIFRSMVPTECPYRSLEGAFLPGAFQMSFRAVALFMLESAEQRLHSRKVVGLAGPSRRTRPTEGPSA